MAQLPCSVDVIDCVAGHLSSPDAAALRCCCRGLRAGVDAVLAKAAPLALPQPCKFGALKSLDLTRLAHPARDADLASALRQLTGLTSLAIGGAGCSALRGDALSPVGDLTRLRSLSVTGCRKVRLSAVGSWHALRLTSLTLVGLAFGPQDGPSLQAFLAAGCGAVLERLVLGDARTLSFVPNAAIAAALSACSPGVLRLLDLSGCLEVTDEGLAPVARLTSLRALVLHNCMKIGDGAIKAMCRLPLLSSLNLRGCSQLGDHHVSALVQGCGALEELSLQTCNGLTGACLAALPSGTRRLAALNLAHCMRLEERHLHHLARLPALRRLDLTGCMAPGAHGLACLAALSALTALGAAGWTQRGASTRQQQQHQQQQQQHQQQQQPGPDEQSQPLQANVAGPGAQTLAGFAPAAARTGSMGSVAAHGWKVPPQVQRLEMRGTSLTRAALRRLLRSLPPVLTHLDLSECQLVPEDNGWASGAAAAAGASASGLAWAGQQHQQPQHGVPVKGAQQLLCASDLQKLSALTALTALQLSGVGASDIGAARGAREEAFGHGSAVGAGETGQAGDGSSSSNVSGGDAASWPGALEGLAGLRVQWAQHGGSGSGSGSGSMAPSTAARLDAKGRASNVRRVLDLDAWAGREVAPLAAPFGASFGHSSPVSTYVAGAGAPIGSLLPATWSGPLLGDFGSSVSGACSCSSFGGTAAGSGVVLQFGDVPPRAGVFRGSLGAAAAGGACSRCSNSGVGGVGSSSMPEAGGWALCHASSPGVPAVRPCLTWLTPLLQLRRLALTHSPWLANAELASLAGLRALECLDVTGCRNLTGAGFEALSGLTCISELVLAGCTGIVDEGAAAAGAAFGRALRNLDLSGCAALGEAGVVALLAAATGLRSLSLAGNRSVGESSLVAASRLRHLRRLDAALCCGIGDSAVAHLAACPSLADVNVRACWQLSEQGVYTLLSQSTSIMSLNVEGCYRLFGCQGCIPDGYDAQQDLSRPGVLARRPPGGAEGRAAAGAAAV